MARTKDITVRVPERVAVQVSRFLAEQEATTIEVFLAARIADMAVGLRNSERPADDDAQAEQIDACGYL